MGEGVRVLVIGGGAGLGAAAREAGRGRAAHVEVAASLSEGLQRLAAGHWGLTILSLDLPGADLALVERICTEPRSGVLVLVAEAPSAGLVMEAMRRGARELLTMPVAAGALEAILVGVGAGREGIALTAVPEEEGEMIGRSPELLEVFKQVGRVAGSAATVLVTGESGTGKELVARAVHRGSERRHRPFVAVNCAAIPEDLLESELFGHERGAFTGAVARKIGRFERAHGGTLFLDEIGDMSLVLQAKILRALQEREVERLGGEERLAVDVRVVAATHRDLAALIEAGEFREDLYYRLAVVRLHLAPLRERRTDIRELALHYGARFASEHGRAVTAIAPDALRRLEAHGWPGNVRELRNVIERAVLLAPDRLIRPEDVALDEPATGTGGAGGGALAVGYPATLSLAEVEALHIRAVLTEVGGHLGRAAEVLGLHRNTVSRKAREYGIEVW